MPGIKCNTWRRLYLLFFLLNGLTGNTYSQPVQPVKIVKVKEYYSITPRIRKYVTYDSVLLKDKIAQKKINKDIRKTVLSLKAEKNWVGGEHYEVYGNIIFSGYDIISCDVSKSIYPERGNGFSTLQKSINFNAVTGERINFHDLFYPKYRSIVDSIVIANSEYRLSENDSLLFVSQLPDLTFIFTENSFNIYLSYESRWGYHWDEINYEVLLPYMNPSGPMEKLIKALSAKPSSGVKVKRVLYNRLAVFVNCLLIRRDDRDWSLALQTFL